MGFPCAIPWYRRRCWLFVFLELSLVGVVGYFAKSYYDTLPKDETVKITVRSLAPYNFEKPEVRPLFVSFSRSVANVNMIGKNLVGGVQLKP